MSGKAVYNAIKKFGWEEIKHEVLFYGLSSLDAEQKERELIALYRSNDRNYGYNLTNGGEKGKRHSEETRHKMSIHTKGMYAGILNPRFGAKCSDETKEKIRNALIGKMRGDKNPNYGKPISEAQKLLISKARKGKHYPKLSESMKSSDACKKVHDQQKRKVSQYTIDGEFIRTWDSARDAALAIIGRGGGQSNICSCANGKLKSAYGFLWKHAEVEVAE